MTWRAALPLALLTLSACEVHFDSEAAEELTSICEPVMFEDTPLTHCIAVPGTQTIGMELRPSAEEQPYRSLRNYSENHEQIDGEPVILVMNGGMYDAQGFPVGYYVEGGERLTVLNQNEGPGNFHMLPNGVFLGESAEGPWHVWDTERFADFGQRPNFATQSGPMLVVNGELHPDISPNGTSLRYRNAVGVDASGRAHLVISEAPLSLGKLARFYRDVLNVRDALYLDGSVSQIWDPATGRLDTGPDIGPLIVVRNQAEGEP